MSWIDQFSRGTFQIYAGNTLNAFQPLDFFHFYPLWYDRWIARIDEALQRIGAYQQPYAKLSHLLPVPSNLRAIVQKIVPSYRAFPHQDAKQCRRVVEFFNRMLQEACAGDPYGEHANPKHSKEEAQQITDTLSWQPADVPAAKQIGRLITAVGSLVHGLYNDLVTDFGWDAYGPYSVEQNNARRILLIRDFPDLQPTELWPAEYLPPIREIKIYGLYEGVDWQISCVGCHTIALSGSPVEGLRHSLVFVNGVPADHQRIAAVTQDSAAKAEAIYRRIRQMGFEELKSMVMLQECYQLKRLFNAAAIDWRPTPEMTARIQGKPLMQGLLPNGTMMTNLAEYRHAFGIDTFARDVLGHNS